MAGLAGYAQETIAGCRVFPQDNVWNRPIDELPVHARSSDYISAAGRGKPLHIDASVPFNVVPPDQPMRQLAKLEAPAESDAGPFPIPANPMIESGTDAHMLILQTGVCRLYEIDSARRRGDSWIGFTTAIYDLTSNRLRPDGWTSADAAGLPILPGLLRYEEVQSGQIRHAVRMTVPKTQRAYVWPARHFASRDDNAALPPMGLRLRLRRDFDISRFSPQAQVVLLALKTYGAFVSDNGSSFYFTATPEGWPQAVLDELKQVKSDDFEAVDASEMMISLNSGQAGPMPTLSEVTLTTSSPDLIIRLSRGQVFTITLTTDAKLTLKDLRPGQRIAFRICQDSHGGHSLAWPAAIHGAMAVGTAPGKCSVQDFIATTDGLYAAAPGITDE